MDQRRRRASIWNRFVRLSCWESLEPFTVCSVFVFKLNSVFFLRFDIVLVSNIKVHITSRKYFQSKYFQKMMDFFYGQMRCLLKYLSLIHGSFMDDIWVQFPRFFWSGGKKKKNISYLQNENERLVWSRLLGGERRRTEIIWRYAGAQFR